LKINKKQRYTQDDRGARYPQDKLTLGIRQKKERDSNKHSGLKREAHFTGKNAKRVKSPKK